MLPTVEEISLFIVVAEFVFFVGFLAYWFYCQRARRVPGLSSGHIEKIPVLNWQEDGAAASSCVICLEEFQAGDKCRILPGCHHDVFHDECIDKWLETTATCPICRAIVS